MSDNKCVIQIRIYRNTLLNTYSAELVFPLRPPGHRVARSFAGGDIQHWLNNVAAGLEVHLEDAEK